MMIELFICMYIPIGKSLNPYSNGMMIEQHGQKQKTLRRNVSLNPYSNGMMIERSAVHHGISV